MLQYELRNDVINIFVNVFTFLDEAAAKPKPDPSKISYPAVPVEKSDTKEKPQGKRDIPKGYYQLRNSGLLPNIFRSHLTIVFH